MHQNTLQFVRGLPANNVLLTGARGTGKSSLVKALLNHYAADGLRLIEVDKQDLLDLPDIVERLAGQPYRFILFCDDLSFNADEPGYTTLKAVLDGSVAATPDNVLIYATSNRRHLMPEYMRENLETKYVGDEIHPGETVEEKISLSERFGLWVSFYPFDQDEYLDIVRHWLRRTGRGRGRRRGDAARSAAVGAAARLAQRARRLAVRARLGGPARHRSARALTRVTESTAWRADRTAGGGRGGGDPPARRPLPPGAATGRQGLRGLLGVPRRQGRARRAASRRRWCASCTKSWASKSRAPIPGSCDEYVYPHAHVRLHFFRVLELAGRTAPARGAGALVGSASATSAWRRCCPPMGRCCARLACPRSWQSPTPRSWASLLRSSGSSGRSRAACGW